MTTRKKRRAVPRAEDADGSPPDAQRLLLELRVQQIELETQNEELRRVQQKLDASLSRYIDFYDRAPVGYCTVSETGLILEANLTLAAWLGVAPGLLVKHVLSRYIRPEAADDYHRFCRKMFRTGEPRTFEFQLVKRDGTTFWASLAATTSHVADGTPVLRFVISDMAERKQAEDARRTLSRAVEQSPASIVITDRAGLIEYVNPRFEQLTGYTAAEVIGKNPSILKSGQTPAGTYEEMWKAISEGGEWQGELCNRAKNGELYWEFAAISGLRDESGEVGHYIAVKENITDRKRAEENAAALDVQLRQAQKMESVGLLAGGVSHEFNNMLAVILGNIELALTQVEPSQPLHADLLEVQKAAVRSSALTRQLLAFARSQPVAPRILDLNETVPGLLTMLQRLIGEDIQVVWQADSRLWPIMMDRTQLEQILTNLVVNARHAIAGVGTLTIAMSNRIIDAEYCATHADVAPGAYVRLTVTDTGHGMDATTVSRIYEPFFTTKAVGQGTGLGLAMVYGAVKQNGGFITVTSAPGEGTSFEIYLPRHAGD